MGLLLYGVFWTVCVMITVDVTNPFVMLGFFLGFWVF